jgi:RNA polymerase sporulation-specific sigma factor
MLMAKNKKNKLLKVKNKPKIKKKDTTKVKTKEVVTVVEKETYSKEHLDDNVDLYRSLVYTIRNTAHKKEIDIAFSQIVKGLDSKIKNLANKFKIPGMGFDDIYQECLFALQYKAIKDYDETKGSTEGPAMFDRFALLCIRRHLATTLKAAHQNKVKVLNDSKSLNADRGGAGSANSNVDEDLSLINICSSKEKPILDRLQHKEFITSFSDKLMKKLSPFEQEVFLLYVQKYSYEEVAQIIIGDQTNSSVKAIDNGLSRIKHKAREIFNKMSERGQAPSINIKKK